MYYVINYFWSLYLSSLVKTRMISQISKKLTLWFSYNFRFFFFCRPSEREETERVIRSALKEIMMSVDLDEVTSKFIRGRLEETLDMDLGEYKPFIDQEMLTVLGQMDAATQIFPHVYLGSEWNASNLDELNRNGYDHNIFCSTLLYYDTSFSSKS